MFTANDRTRTREVFFQAWRRHRENVPLEGIERLVVAVVLKHPEYQPLLEHPEAHHDRDYFPETGETNPFLHLGMHIAIEEQLSIDQPKGVLACYRDLLRFVPDEHEVQHRMMACLGEMLRQAHRDQSPPDQAVYLGCLRRLIHSG